MTSDLTPIITTAEFVDVVTQAVAAFRGEGSRPNSDILVNALLQAEKAAKQQKFTYSFESLFGDWQLCFATGTKKVRKRGGILLGKGFYLPKLIKISISFHATTEQALGRGEITNQIQLAGVSFQLKGPAHYQGKKNLLAFDFTQMQVSFFGRVVYNGQIRGGKSQTDNFYNLPIAKLPFFAFFLITEDLIAARGRGGGLALWIRS